MFREIIDLFKATFLGWQEDNASQLAAALAYYAAISLAPLVILLVAILGFALGPDAARGEIAAELEALIGAQSAQVIEEIIEGANKPVSGVFATIFGVATLLVGASGVFGALQDGLNRVWEVEPKSVGILTVIKNRFISLTMVLGTGFLLLVSLFVSAALAAFGKYLGGWLPLPVIALGFLNFVVSFGVITILFAVIYKVLPDVEVRWSDVWIGAVITALLFTIGKFLIGLYLGRSSVASAYGAAGSLVVILIWVYYSSQILFFGAEFTYVYAHRNHQRLDPSEKPTRVTDKARGQQGLPAR